MGRIPAGVFLLNAQIISYVFPLDGSIITCCICWLVRLPAIVYHVVCEIIIWCKNLMTGEIIRLGVSVEW